MNTFIKNILLLAVVCILSYFAAPYFGAWYDKFSPQYDDSFFSFPHSIVLFVAGIPVAYVFFISLVFTLFGFGDRKKWLIGLLIPALLFWLSADKYHIYLPTIFCLIAYGSALVFRKLLRLLA